MIEIDNKEYIDDFNNYLKIDKNYSNNTVESYIRDIRYFLEYTNKEILDISKKDIDNYILHILMKYLCIRKELLLLLQVQCFGNT